MRAYIALQTPPGWMRGLGLRTGALLEVNNSTILDHWLRACLANDISDVWLIGSKHHLKEVWNYAADGHRWGLSLRYRCEANASGIPVLTADPLCRRDGGAWFSTNSCPAAGAVGNYLFPRCAATTGKAGSPANIWCPTADCISDLLHRRVPDWSRSKHGVPPVCLSSAKVFLEHNHRHLLRTLARAAADDSIRIGYNSRVALSAQLLGPVLIGNNCRIGPGCKIGPGAIIGDHCVVEARTTVVRSCVLPDTYLSSDLELNNKIACANAIVSEHCAFADPAQQLCAAFAPLSLGAESRRFA